MTKDEIALLSDIDLFRALPIEGMRLLADSGERRRLRAGEVLFHQGQIAESGYLVVRGSIHLSTTPATREKIIAIGGFIGEMAIIIEQRRLVTAIARETSEIIRISAQNYRKIVNEFPQAAAYLARVIQMRLHDLTHELADVREKFEAFE
jgi:CRP-like cAMP-binding protein